MLDDLYSIATLLQIENQKMALLNSGMIEADAGTRGRGDTGIMVDTL